MQRAHRGGKKHGKRKHMEPFQEVSRAAPIGPDATKVKSQRVAADPDEHDEELRGEKTAANKILDALLGSGGSSTANTCESSFAKKRKEVAVSGNWAKLRAQLPPPSQNAAKKPLLIPSSSASAAADAKPMAARSVLPTTVTFNSTSEETRPTKYVGLDCEMVGIGENGSESALARVSLVNSFGNTVYDQFVKPTEAVVDYRTRWSGIRPIDLQNAIPFKQAQKEVAEIIKDRILVGHALQNDLKVLLLTHPFPMQRDTSKYKPLMRSRGKPRALRHLAREHLGVQIQQGEHSSVEDAKAAMLIYLKMRKDWEAKAQRRRHGKGSKGTKKTKAPAAEAE